MLFFIVFVVCVGGMLFGLYAFFGRPNSGFRSARVSVGGAVFKAEIADTALARTRGLSGRDSLPADGGMLFIFPSPGANGFWMRDMKFPIDIIWIRDASSSRALPGNAREGTVVGITEHAIPEPGKPLWKLELYYPPDNVDTVLEVNAGTAKKYGLQMGDRVTIEVL